MFKAIMTGMLGIALLVIPTSEFSFDSEPQKVEASSQAAAMYAKKQVNAYKSRSTASGSVMTVPYGVRVDRLAIQSSWSQVRYNGKIGWVASRDLVEIKKIEVFDTQKAVTLYVSRSKKAKAVTTVPSNKQVTRLAMNKSWSQVKYGGKTGWTASSNLKLRYTKETFALKKYRVKEVAPLQSSYSTSSDVIATLPDFGVVESVERYNNWYKVTFDNRIGWVEAKYLTTYKEESVKDAMFRIYGDSYEIFKGHGMTARKVDDIVSVEFDYHDDSAMLELFHNDENNPQIDEYLKAAKIITLFNGGDPNKLADKLFYMHTEGYKWEDEIIYDKYKISNYNWTLHVYW